MDIRKSYIITPRTKAIMPFIAESGDLYTVVLEEAAIAVIAKTPTKLIQENKQFIDRQQQKDKRIYEDCWEQEITQNGKSKRVKFSLRMDKEGS